LRLSISSRLSGGVLEIRLHVDAHTPGERPEGARRLVLLAGVRLGEGQFVQREEAERVLGGEGRGRLRRTRVLPEVTEDRRFQADGLGVARVRGEAVVHVPEGRPEVAPTSRCVDTGGPVSLRLTGAAGFGRAAGP
jgi:hypothetical protein